MPIFSFTELKTDICIIQIWMIFHNIDKSSRFVWIIINHPFLESDLTWPVNKANPLYFISNTS